MDGILYFTFSSLSVVKDSFFLMTMIFRHRLLQYKNTCTKTLPLLCHSQYKIISVFRVAYQLYLFWHGLCHSNNWPKVSPIKKYSNCTLVYKFEIWERGNAIRSVHWLFHIAFRKKIQNFPAFLRTG